MQNFITIFWYAELYTIISDAELYNNYLSWTASQQLPEMQSFITIIWDAELYYNYLRYRALQKLSEMQSFTAIIWDTEL